MKGFHPLLTSSDLVSSHNLQQPTSPVTTNFFHHPFNHSEPYIQDHSTWVKMNVMVTIMTIHKSKVKHRSVHVSLPLYN